MWMLTLCLWVNGDVIACDTSTRRFSIEAECRRALVQMVDGLDVTAMQKAGQDIDIDCVRMPFSTSLRSPMDRGRGRNRTR